MTKTTLASSLRGVPLMGLTEAGATVLAETATAARTLFLAVDGGQIAYDDTGGDGPVVLAIPGMGDLRSEYRLLLPALKDAGYRVLTMDVRGFGETSAQWNDYSARAVGRDAIALLDHLQATSAVVLGNSFAAGSALWAAREAPSRVRGVVLLGPIVRDGKVAFLTRAVLWLGFAGPWRVWFWMTYWDSLFPTEKPKGHAQAKAALARNLKQPGRMSALKTMIRLSKGDTESILTDSRVPALVIMGTRDPDFPDATAEANWLTSKLAAQELLVEGAGHYPHAEMSALVAPKVVSFLRSLNSDSSTNVVK